MSHLAADRPIFHSEADFQHAFAQVVHGLNGELQVRLEVRQDDAEYLDLFCYGPRGRTSIEFKYFTAAWHGVDQRGEAFRLRSQAATDVARREFVFDIERLERFCQRRATQGLAIMLTNARALWSPVLHDRRTRDHEFRIHEGQVLSGTLRWADGGYAANERTLVGEYSLGWRDYRELAGSNGMFRWLAVEVG
jgi:hypothetical protein